MDIQLQTPRLWLRPLGAADLDSTHAYAGDREVGKYMLFLPNDTKEETLRFLRGAEAQWASPEPESYEFAIMLGSEHIGAVSLYREGDAGELGWVLRRDRQGMGYATEAARALVDYAVHTLGLRRIIAHCDTRNLPSSRVMEKLGMVRVLEEPRQYPDGEQAREWMYELKIN